MNRPPTLSRFTIRYSSLVMAVLALVLVTGCRENESTPLQTPPEARKNAEGFGKTYEITMNRTPDLPDEPPHLVGDTLVAQVAYPGGCADHDFQLGYQATPETTRLWLHHRAGGDRCSTRVYDEVRRAVPDSMLGRPTTLLLMPQDSVPFELQMNR